MTLGWYGLYHESFFDNEADISSSRFYLYVDANDCGCISIADGETLTVTFDGGQTLTVYLPDISSGNLFVADDGSTYWDQDLTLSGNLKKEEGGNPVAGEDCVWVLKQGK